VALALLGACAASPGETRLLDPARIAAQASETLQADGLLGGILPPIVDCGPVKIEFQEGKTIVCELTDPVDQTRRFDIEVTMSDWRDTTCDLDFHIGAQRP
jgi:hypothetical protein